MSRYKPYPIYKNSGSQWIRVVPEQWEVKRLGFFFEERRDKVSDTEFLPLSVTMGGIVPQIAGVAKTEDNENRKKVCVGDFVINSRSDRKGSSGLSELDGSVSVINTVLRPSSLVDGRFIHHLFRSTAFQEEYYRYGNGLVADLWTTHYSDMRNIVLGIPPLSEQTAIAAALDRETARIDALIEKKTRFVELLKEKRQALITHAVTKGLDPNVKMKDSGVEWIGQIPEHWELRRLRHVATYTNSNVDKKSYDGQKPVKLCNYTDVYYHEFITSSISFMDATASESEIAAFSLRKGDVLITKDSEDPSDIGIPALVSEDLPGVICGYHLTIIRTHDSDDSVFLHRSIQSHPTKAHFFVESPGITRYGLNQDAIGDIIVCFPPEEERVGIASWINREVTRIDALINRTERSIALLKERRAALITAAVTGQIDLREEVA